MGVLKITQRKLTWHMVISPLLAAMQSRKAFCCAPQASAAPVPACCCCGAGAACPCPPSPKKVSGDKNICWIAVSQSSQSTLWLFLCRRKEGLSGKGRYPIPEKERTAPWIASCAMADPVPRANPCAMVEKKPPPCLCWGTAGGGAWPKEKGSSKKEEEEEIR